MKKFLLLGVLVAGCVFLVTVSTAEAGHDSCYSDGYGYGSYYPSYGSYYPSYDSYSPGWSYYQHGHHYHPDRYHHGYHGYYGHHDYYRSGFGLHVGGRNFGFSIHR